MTLAVTYTIFDDMVVKENRGGVESFYMSDTLGSTSQLVDPSGNVTDTFTYWPYGEVRTRTGTTKTPYTFIGILGYYYDAVMNWFYVRARYYLPTVGRWLTVDPLWPEESAYIYALDAPHAVPDPTGLCVGPLPCTRREIEYCKTTVCGARGFNYCVAEICDLTCDGFYRVSYCKCNRAKGCTNKCPAPRTFVDLVPPSKPHFFKNLGCCCKGSHTHIVEYNQLPYPDCRCIPGRRREGTCLDLTKCTPGPC